MKQKIISLLLIAFIISGGAGAYMYKTAKTARIKAAQEELRIKEEAKEQRKQEIQTLYDAYLNDFTQALRDKTENYKKSRKFLNDISSPYNFETPELAKENYTLFTKELLPALRKQINNIIALFDQYEQKLKTDVAQDESDIKNIFMDQWVEMSKEQLMSYVNFFAKEDLILSAYNELVTFAYVHSMVYSVDLETNQFIFKRKKDETKYNALIKKIKDLKAQH